jgi:hypothetical protein
MIFSPSDVVTMLKRLPRCDMEDEYSDCMCGEARSYMVPAIDDGEYVKWIDVLDLITALENFRHG